MRRRFALVLHTHVPYVRRNGVWPAGEDWFHQACADSYLPLAGAFERLAERGLHGFATVALTPVLAHQMIDEHMRREFESYLAREELRALRQVANYRDRHAGPVKDLAALYARRARDQAAFLAARGGLTAAFRALQDAGAIELMGGPATHPLLPAIASDRLRAAQIETGLAAHTAIFGRRPEGIWIPECAVAPGVEESLAARGVRYAVVDPVATGGTAAIRAGDTDLLALARATATTQRVWAAGGGYPAGPLYRDFHHYDLVAGFKNWRITDPAAPLGDKEPYDPGAADAAARADANAFVAALDGDFAGRDTLVVAFDTELFGHWWFEGPVWLEAVFEALAAHPTIRPVTLGEAQTAAAEDAIRAPLRESTWGQGSDWRNWRAPPTEDLFARLAAAEARALPHLDATGPLRDQMLRELMLAQSSDWSYMIARDESAGYGRERFEAHMARLLPLLDALDGNGATDPSAPFAIDNCFAALPAPGGA